MQDKKIYTYEIGGTKYQQKKLVLGQIRQMADLCVGLNLPTDSDITSWILALKDKLPAALTIVLTPEGILIKDKDLASLSKEIEFSIEPEQVIEVVKDFFDCNQAASLLNEITAAIKQITERINLGTPTGSTSSSVSSAEETSLKEKVFSGDTA
jgi:hypothetical protein